MAYLTSSREGKRFLGNRDNREVHDLRHEDKNQGGCRISELIRSGQAVGFIIDNLEQTHKERYVDCPRCIGKTVKHADPEMVLIRQ